jgi:hypothetical protein
MNARYLTLPAAIGGAVDTALFLVRRPKLFGEAPGRAAGSVGVLAAWLALAAAAARDARSGRKSIPTIALSQVLLAGNGAMLAVHLRSKVFNPRVFLGAGLSAAASAGALLE